jgi:glycosyltransferase involved in cell wall biosynthesis
MMLLVVIPAFDEEYRIGETLDSMAEYLARQFHEFEAIVVDDGGADETRRVVREKRPLFPRRGGIAEDAEKRD